MSDSQREIFRKATLVVSRRNDPYDGRFARMVRCHRGLETLKGDKTGVTALEYALMTALIALAIVGSLNAFNANLNAMFANIGNQLDGAFTRNSTAAANR